ncbi:MAG: lantibiotic dehydratase, partial [Ktedonobacteraceae bacterium]|nr:lantibiotic dehydratase [Ktedonobacteraceae bacterium]
MAEQKMAKTVGLYEPAGFFLLRTPAMPADAFIRMLAPDDNEGDQNNKSGEHARQTYDVLSNMAGDPATELALFVASANLHEGLARAQSKESKPGRIKRAYSRLLRYLIRMSTRPTPFGLFSGVAVGTLDKQTTLQLGQTAITSMRTRPDMGWLLNLIQRIEEDSAVRPFLHVMANKAVYIAGARAILPNADVYGLGDNRSIALRATPVVQFLLEKAKDPLPFEELRRELCSTFPQAPLEKVDAVLQQLWEMHFLISDLRPPLTDAQPERYILEHLRMIPQLQELADELEKIIEQCHAIDEAGIQNSLPQVSQLVEQQKRMFPTYNERTYQVDARLGLKETQLNQEVGTAVVDTIET